MKHRLEAGGWRAGDLGVWGPGGEGSVCSVLQLPSREERG